MPDVKADEQPSQISGRGAGENLVGGRNGRSRSTKVEHSHENAEARVRNAAAMCHSQHRRAVQTCDEDYAMLHEAGFRALGGEKTHTHSHTLSRSTPLHSTSSNQSGFYIRCSPSYIHSGSASLPGPFLPFLGRA